MCFDTETDKLPQNIKIDKYKSYKDFSNVNLQQISYILFDSSDLNKITKTYSTYVNYLSPIDIIEFTENKITHITLEQLQCGKSVKEVLDDFYNDLINVNIIIAHNALFDVSLMKNLAFRNKHFKLFNLLKNIYVFDTMFVGGSLGLNIINKPYIKLEDLYKEIIDLNNDSITDIITKHEALDDTMHCYYCFLYLIKHLGYCQLNYTSNKLLFKDIYNKKDYDFLQKCYNCKQFSSNKLFILYCCCKNGIYNDDILNIFN